MSDLNNEYRQWAALMDREASGIALTPQERAFCDDFVAQNPLAQREIALLEELADLDVSVQDTDTRALVDGALARLAGETRAEEARAQSDAVQQIRRGARLPRAAWLLGLGGAVAAAAALMLLVDGPGPTHSAPMAQVEAPAPAPAAARIELVYASGDVSVNGQPSMSGDALLAEGSVIAVGDTGAACLAMDPEINLCLQAGARLLLSRTESPWRMLELQAGKVAAQLGPQPEGMRLSIVADGVWSTAVGTAFTVQAGAEQATGRKDGGRGVDTTVLHGKVSVGPEHGGQHLVVAHQRASVREGEATVTAISRNDESPEWALLRPAKLWDSPVSATLHVSGLPEHTEVLLDGEAIGTAPLSTLVPVGPHRLEVRIREGASVTREFATRAGQAAKFDFSEAPSAHAAPEQAELERSHHAAREGAAAKSAPAAREKSAAVMLTEARQLMQQSLFEEAAARYTELRRTHPGSREARIVLVPLGQLQLRLGRPEGALKSLDRYLAGGHGTLGEEARHTRIRALRALDRANEEAGAIQSFLELHPDSFHAPALRQRLDSLNR